MYTMSGAILRRLTKINLGPTVEVPGTSLAPTWHLPGTIPPQTRLLDSPRQKLYSYQKLHLLPHSFQGHIQER
jgi:hypothetical protein